MRLYSDVLINVTDNMIGAERFVAGNMFGLFYNLGLQAYFEVNESFTNIDTLPNTTNHHQSQRGLIGGNLNITEIPMHEFLITSAPNQNGTTNQTALNQAEILSTLEDIYQHVLSNQQNLDPDDIWYSNNWTINPDNSVVPASLAAHELSLNKDASLNILNHVYNTMNNSGLYTLNQTELDLILNTGKTNIQNATTVEEVSSFLDLSLTEFDTVLNNLDQTKSDLITSINSMTNSLLSSGDYTLSTSRINTIKDIAITDITYAATIEASENIFQVLLMNYSQLKMMHNYLLNTQC